MTLSRLVARPLVAAGILYLAQGPLRNPRPVAVKARPAVEKLAPLAQQAGVPVPQDPETLVRINAGVQAVGALALGTGRAPRLGAAMIAGSLVPVTVAGHSFWKETNPDAKKHHTTQFFKNLALIGSLIIVSGDTEGKPGVAWRARRAAKDARREAKHLATVAKARAA